jgi:hypothetical protein
MPVIISLVPPQPGTAQTVADLRIIDQIYPYMEQGGSYLAGPGDSLWQLMDGGAIMYVDRGLVDWIHQGLELTPDSTHQANLTIMNFGTSKKAALEYDTVKTTWAFNFSPALAIPGFKDSVAIAVQVGGGIRVAAHFNEFYIEFYMQGYLDAEINTALADAAHLITWYRMRIMGQ